MYQSQRSFIVDQVGFIPGMQDWLNIKKTEYNQRNNVSPKKDDYKAFDKMHYLFLFKHLEA